jgi:hypothetical protein
MGKSRRNVRTEGLMKAWSLSFRSFDLLFMLFIIYIFLEDLSSASAPKPISTLNILCYDMPEDTNRDHYIRIDVDTSSARACVINSQGNIFGLASQNIKTWQPYEQSTINI